MGENPSTVTDESAAPEPAAASPARTAHYRAFLLRLHFYAGIFVGPFLLIAAVTGGVYAIAPSVEQVLYRDQLESHSSGDLLPVADQVRAAQAIRPDLAVTAAVLSTNPASERVCRRLGLDLVWQGVTGEALRVRMRRPPVPGGEACTRLVFADRPLDPDLLAARNRTL